METELKLIELCKNDTSCFKELYKLYVNDVYKYCFSVAGRKELAEDATSFTFLKAIEGIERYEFRGKTIKCWLFTIARNYIYKSFRKERNLSLDEEIGVEENDDLLDTVIKESEIDRITKEIKDLNLVEREILRLRLIENLEFSEISLILECSLSKAKMRYYRAIKKLRDKIS